MSIASVEPFSAKLIRIDPADPMVALGRGPAIAYRDWPVHELVEAQVHAGPDRDAVECGGTTLSYRDLWMAAGAVRDFLLRAGLRPGTPVGVALPRTQLLMPALLGIWRAGGGYVPLDDQMPALRRDRILDEAGAHGMRWILVDHRDKAGSLGVTPVREIGIEGWPQTILACQLDADRTEPDAGTDLADLAYVMYTSGSTGQAKGTVITHRNISALLNAVGAALGADAGEVSIATIPLTFDMSVLELFWPLSAGRRLVLLDSMGNLKPGVLGAVLRRPGRKLLQATPSTAALVDFPEGTDQLRLFVAGEALPRQTAARLLPHCDSLVNLYGPTETTVYVTQHQVRDLGSDAVVSIGRPLPNCGLVVLDDDHRPVPVGVAGELYVYGPQVAAGYLSTNAASGAFLSDAERAQPVYRTGDRVAWSADGTLRFLGRVDHQVKIAGNRVELGEIEAALRAHAQVNDAVVILDRDCSPPRLRAFVQPEDPDERHLEMRGIWEHLLRYLPAHMLPASVRLLPRLPLTSSGKVDRVALATGPVEGADIPRQQARHSPVDPPGAAGPGPAGSGTLVLVLVRLVELANSLHGSELGPDDDLVQAGFTSLEAIRLAGQAWRRFGWDITGGQILRLRTLREVAGHFGHSGNPTPQPEAQVDGVPSASISLAQRAMLAASYLDPGNTKMNILMRWQLDGPVDEARMRIALGTVVTHHPALRTLYPLAEDPVVLEPSREQSLIVVGPDHGTAAAAGPGQSTAAVAGPGQFDGASSPDQLMLMPFDLEHVPPVRWMLDRSGPASAWLYAVLHHVAVDEAALATLHDALVSAYAGAPLPIEPSAIRYSAVCATERRLLDQRRQSDRAFWRSRRGSFTGTIGFGKGHRGLTGARARRQAATLPGGATMTQHAARSMDVTTYSLFLAAAASTVARALGGSSVIVGVPVSSREAVGGEGLLGCFANLVPLAIRDYGEDIARTIRDSHAAVLEGLDHGLLPLAEITQLAELPDEDASDRSPRPQSQSNWAPRPVTPQAQADWARRPEAHAHSVPRPVTSVAQADWAPSFVCQLASVPQPAVARGVTFTPVFGQPARAFYPVVVRGETSNGDLAVYADYDPGAIDDDLAQHLLQELLTTLTRFSHVSK
ncbi:MAG TPA: amino acid adenylation domain-containing protein [Streptosporangiaceae bacterium]